LLSTLGYLDLCGFKVIKFDVTDVRPPLPYHMSFQIYVEYTKHTIKRTIIDEGVATFVMSLIYWKAIGSPTLSQSVTMLTDFDGHSLRIHEIIPSFLVQLGGKTVKVDVKVVNAPLDYNLLLGHNWTYSMTRVMSSIFHTFYFPREGKKRMIDQFSFVHTIRNASVGSSVPMIDNSQQETKDVGVKMCSSFIGIFDFVAPIHHIHAISIDSSLSMRSFPFCTSYFNDPWSLPSPTMSYGCHSHIGMEMPLSVAEIVYQSILDAIVDPDPFSLQTDEDDIVLEPVWAIQYYCLHDFINYTLPSFEAILEAMYGPDRPWDDIHHRSYFLPDLVRIKEDEFISTLSEMVGHVVVPLCMHGIYAEGNMENISPTIMIDISRIHGKIKNVYIAANCSP
jgi:hypothetical protein